ncbi:homoserine dehydrogenase [bacterium]|nr:homoserine dehydrogenase [bacterium]
MSRTPQINIGLFGLGTVGSQVHEILVKNKELLSRKLGFPLHLKKICEPDSKKIKQFNIPASMAATKPAELLDDPEISIIVELIGDKPVALEIMKHALSLGKHVVTANKAILAHHGPELYKAAAEHEVDILFEAAVAGAIPILRSIREGFVADRIVKVLGIINGTSNYILSGMAHDKKDFATVLAEAQKSGYAEADPTADIEGIDPTHKITILTALAYGQLVPVDKVYREGITQITPHDFAMAERFGFAIKLLGISKMRDNGALEVRVHPTLVPKTHSLAPVDGAFNAVMVEGEKLGSSLFYGMGAGGPPTATAVVADIVEIARNLANQVPGVPPLGYKIEEIQKAKLVPMDDIESEYYLRFNVQDKPGVLAKISAILGQNNISISSLEQEGLPNGSAVPIVILTHKALEKNVQASIKEIDKLNFMTAKTFLLRIER